MAVALRGFTQGAYLPTGTGTAAWPSGTVAGDLAVLGLLESSKGTPDSKPLTDGWLLKQAGPTTTLWYKRVTATDLAAPLPVQGYVVMLQTFFGAGKLGNATTTNGVKLTVAGAGLIMFCRADEDTANLTPTLGKLHSPDIVNASNVNRRHNMWFFAYATTGYKTVSTNVDYVSCFEALPLEPPTAPLLNTPAIDEQIDPADVVTFGWQHQSSSGVPQDEFKVRIREVSTATWYYVTAGSTLSTTEAGIATAAATYPLNSGLVAGKTYEWSAATKDSNAWGPWATARRFTTADKPVVTSITYTAPAEDLSPVISWAATMGLGSQVAYQVMVKAEAAPNRTVWDSGVRSGNATTVNIPNTVEWVNGEALRVFVKVRQTGGLWSLLTADNVTMSVTWTPPSAPLGVYAANYPGEPLRVTLAGLNVAYDNVEVESTTDDVTWRHLIDVAPSAAILEIGLPHAVYGIPTRFRARQATVIDGIRAWSPWRVSDYMVPSLDKSAYIIAADGASWLQVRIRGDEGRTIVEGITVSYGLGADRADVHRTPQAGQTGKTVFAPRTKADRETLKAFLTLNPIFQIRWSPEIENHQIWVDAGITTVQRVSPLSEDRLTQYALAVRDIPVDWVEQ